MRTIGPYDCSWILENIGSVFFIHVNLVSKQEYTITYGLMISDTMSIWYQSRNIQ